MRKMEDEFVKLVEGVERAKATIQRRVGGHPGRTGA